ncbi:MAG: hypothetical protein ACTSRK_15885 [Promethearchaeota archaeon]
MAEFSVLKEIEVDANNSIPYKRDENISIDPEFPPKDQKDYLPLLKLLTHRVCTIEPIDTKRVKITSVNGDKSFKDWLNSVSVPLEVVEENFKAHNNYFKQVKSILSKNPKLKSTIMVGEASLIQTFENLKAYFLDPKRDKERKKGNKWKDKDDKGDDLDETNIMVGDEDEDSVEVEDPDSKITSSPIEISINLPKIRKLLKPLPNSKNFIPFLVYARQICFQGKKKLEPFPSPTPQFRASIGNRSFYGQSEIGRFNTAYIFGHYQPIPSSEKNLFQLQALYYVLKINPPKGDSFLLTTRLDRPSRSFPLFEDIDTLFRSMDEDRFNEKSEFVIGYHQTGNNDSIPPELMQNRVQTLQDHMFRLFGVSTYQELFGKESLGKKIPKEKMSDEKIFENDLYTIQKMVQLNFAKKSEKGKKSTSIIKSVSLNLDFFKSDIMKSLTYFMSPTSILKDKAKIFSPEIEKIYSLIRYFKSSTVRFPDAYEVSKNPIKSSEIRDAITFSIGYFATHIAYYLDRSVAKDDKGLDLKRFPEFIKEKLKDKKIKDIFAENDEELSKNRKKKQSDALFHFSSASDTKWLSAFQYFLIHIFPQTMKDKDPKTRNAATNPQWPLNSPKIEMTPQGRINLYLPFTSFNPIPYTPSGSDVIHAATDLGIRSLFNTVYTCPSLSLGPKPNPEPLLRKISLHGQAALESQIDPLIAKSLALSHQSEQLQKFTDTRPFHSSLRKSRRKRTLEKKQIELVRVASHQGLAQQMRQLDHFRRDGIKGKKYIGRFQLERLNMDGGGKGLFSKEKNRWIYGTVFDHWDAQCIHHQVSGRKVSPSYSSQLCNQCHRIGVKGFITKKFGKYWALTKSTFEIISATRIFNHPKVQKKFTKGTLSITSRRILQKCIENKFDEKYNEKYLILNPPKESPVEPKIIFLPQGAGNWFYCPHCDTFQDRDANAAYNLAKYNSLMQNSARCQLLFDRLASESLISSLSSLILSQYITRKRGLKRVNISILKSVKNFFTNIINANLGSNTNDNTLKWTNDVSIFNEFRSFPKYSAAIGSINLALAKIHKFCKEEDRTSDLKKFEIEINPDTGNPKIGLLTKEFYNKLSIHARHKFYTKNPKLRWFPELIIEPNEDPPPKKHHQPDNPPS